MNDLIDRQAAIDALLKEVRLVDGYYVENDEVIDKDDAIEAIRLLPSAQPEIIRCKDCMHNGSYDTDCPISWNGKEYCSFAERRTDELGDK